MPDGPAGTASAAAVVLAAGASSRLGTLKQLLIHDGQTLVARAVDAARRAGCDPIVVVTGAHAPRVEASLATTDAMIAHNERWTHGQGTSVATGVRHLQASSPACAAALITLCDQPHVPDNHLASLVQIVLGADASIAATEHADGRPGVPACFAAEWFDALTRLTGTAGARDLIRSAPPESIRLISAPGAWLDIDTPDDLHRLGHE